ncbi:metallophosphoesterase [Spiribacter halobius]|uniref:Phosphoesterase n=1 Tax=Sediminicurvatus halobius TaxID=2182432 RepID=A0A2U2MXH4_9GAMM|nr:metallophosphoesterase [Spiribacter halobius]PWG61516.1 phosphoesterase [Spiribacter halobius]UEX77995.1 metallophosphoesterase [Spiribacter halobius]
MEIRYVSDLHLEVSGRGLRRHDPRFELPVTEADLDRVLVLAGDIDVGEWAAQFALQYAGAFRAVVLVAGNHEYYDGSIPRVVQKLRDAVAAEGIGNVHVLERGFVEIGTVVFIGATLWTDFRGGKPLALKAAQRGMRDFRRIRHGPPAEPYAYRFRPRDAQALHLKSTHYIEREVTSARERGIIPVVITHHAPYYPDGPWGPQISFSYGSDLGEVIARVRPSLWIHGHTHDTVDTYVAGCRVVSNARGYGGIAENERFDPHQYVRVP